MKRKYATQIISQTLKSMVDEERITETEENLLSRIISDIFYDGKIRINHYLDCYKEYFEELTQSKTNKKERDKQ